MGGRHEFVSEPGSGTLLYLVVPIAKHDPSQETSEESPYILDDGTRRRPKTGHLPRLKS